MPMTLVTGAGGLVGRAVIDRLTALGTTAVATDLDTSANRTTAKGWTGHTVRWADLTDPDAVRAMVDDIKPDAVIHPAAVIPPLCYAKPSLARRSGSTGLGTWSRPPG